MSSHLRFQLPTDLRIPTLPAHVAELTRLIDSPEAGVLDVSALIKQDPALSMRVLRIANSSIYGLREPCLSIEQASTLLGLRLLRSLVVQAALLQTYAHVEQSGFDLERIWRRSALVGQVAACLARHSRSALLPAPEEAYLIGLLCDIGQVLLLDNLGEEYLQLHVRAREHSLALHFVELRDLGTTHAAVGGLLATQWKLPEAVRTGIEGHHGRRASDLAQAPVYLIQRSGQITDRVLAQQPVEAASALVPELEARFGIEAHAVAEAIGLLEEDSRRAQGKAA